MMLRDPETALWPHRSRDETLLVPEPRLDGHGRQHYALANAVGLGFPRTGTKAGRVLQQMSTICQHEELVHSGAAFLYLGAYVQPNTGFTGGYQRVTTWRDAFTSGPYAIPGHVDHSVTQSEPTYAGNLATLTGGGSAVLTFDNSTCRYTVGGAFSAKTAHTLVTLSDVQALPAHSGIEFDCTNRTSFTLGNAVDGHWYWYDGANQCTSAAFERGTGEQVRSFIGDNADASFTFYRDADTDVVAKGSCTVKAITGTVSLFNYLSGSYGTSAKRAVMFYCSGKYPDAHGLVRTLQGYLNNLSHPTAVATINALRAIALAEEASGGSCFLLLPGNWTLQQPILTAVDVLTEGVIPGVGYAGHTAHNATPVSESLSPWTTTMPNGAGAIYFANIVRYMNAAGSMGAGTNHLVGLAVNQRGLVSQPILNASVPPYSGGVLLGTVGTQNIATYDGVNRIVGTTKSGVQSVVIDHVASTGKARLYHDGVAGAESDWTPRAFSGSLFFGHNSFVCNLDMAALLVVQSTQPIQAELRTLFRQYAQLACGAP